MPALRSPRLSNARSPARSHYIDAHFVSLLGQFPVVVTVRAGGYSQKSGITGNPAGTTRGNSNSAYGNDLLMWVK